MQTRRPATAPGRRWVKWTVLGAVVLAFGGCTAWVVQSVDHHATRSFSEGDIQASVIDTCQDSVRKSLKDPDSAKFSDDWKAWKITTSANPPAGMSYNPTSGDVYWNASGSVNGKNGFGAYAGAQPYYCDVVVGADNKVRARSESVVDRLNSP